ncbi:MAG TPA: tripartite tricarboxylate transporter substrate binding protein [Burkholderiales bacterium]
MRKLLLFLGLCLAAELAAAQGYPSKPVRLIIPFPPGGSTDLVARSITPRLGELLGQQIVLEYKGGAGGSIGTAEAARAAPDGYTLLIVWDTHAVNHHLYKVQYDFSTSFEPISLLLDAPGMLVAHPGFGPSSVRELIDFAKANPGKASVGMVGAGSSGHLAAVRFSQLTGTQLTTVNYKGGGPLTNDILGGHVHLVFGSLPLWEQHVRSGKLKALAMLSAKRLPQFPDLPTASETVPGFELKTWFGLLAPAGLPPEVAARLNQDVVRALADPQVNERLVSRGFRVAAGTAEAFAAFLKRESEAAGRLIKAANITVQ